MAPPPVTPNNNSNNGNTSSRSIGIKVPSAAASYPTTPPSGSSVPIAQTPDRPPRLWNPGNPQYQAQHHSSITGNGEEYPTSSSSNTNNRPYTQVQIDPAFEESELLGLDMSGTRLHSLPFNLFTFESLFELRLNDNKLTRLPPQISQLKNLVYLDLSDNALTSLPREIGKLVNLQELLLYNNQLVSLPAELGYLYQLESLGLDGNPLQEPFPTLIHTQSPLSIPTYLREHVLNINPPSERIWHSLADIPQGRNNSSYAIVPLNNTFTLLSYNILAEKYASTQQYGYVASWYLSWEVRKQMILHEVLSYDPDIVCLQEVEANQFEQYFKPQLRMRGNYDGIFAPKSRARTMNEWDRNFVDGCAIFFKMDRFRLVEQHLIEFNQLALARPSLRKHKDMYNRVMTRDNIALVARLQMLLGPASWTELLVTNVHIHWDPSFRDVKLVQTIMLTEELEKIIANINAGIGRLPMMKRKEIGVIVCGDFNSLPDSGVVSYLTKGGIGPRHTDFQNHTYEPYSNEGARNSLNLRSAYSHISQKLGLSQITKAVKDEDDEEVEEDQAGQLVDPLIPFTNLTPGFQGCIDYVYYGSEGSLVVTGALGGLPADYVKQLVGLPSPHFPSDHISLLVEFKVDEGSAREIITTSGTTATKGVTLNASSAKQQQNKAPAKT